MWRRLLILTGIAALTAWLVRRGRAGEAAAPASADPSDELRRRLDEARRREESAQATEAVPEASAAPEDLDTRRRQVHDRARAAVDEMHGGTG